MRTLAISILTAALSLPFAALAQNTTPAPDKPSTETPAPKAKKHKKNHKKTAPSTQNSTTSSTPAPAPAKK